MEGIIIDRLEDLEQSIDDTTAHMLAVYASEYLDCDKCLIKRKCQNPKMRAKSCTKIWLEYLEGKI